MSPTYRNIMLQSVFSLYFSAKKDYLIKDIKYIDLKIPSMRTKHEKHLFKINSHRTKPPTTFHMITRM